ncbi:HD domain-containing protein [Candidatus Nomurabacteria bacterium]|nr:HD domain-containing protein [Candidatus Nomurabacteria bacterium]
MGRNILDIYKEYKIIPSLQMHMLRVAAVAYSVCDNLTVPVNKEEIITACLFHDMGNILKFKMDVIPQFFEPEGVAYWSKVKDEYLEKYGENEHEATVEIMKEVGLADGAISLAHRNRFSLICEHFNSGDISMKILHYADGRVNPYGIVSYEDRMNEARKRYQGGESSIKEEERQKLVNCGKQIEKQIFEKCKIKPEDITDESVARIIKELKNFVVK